MPHSMLLQPMLARLPRAGSPRDLLDATVREVVALHGVHMGMAQMPAFCGDLIMVAQTNIPAKCLAGFARVSLASGTVCGRAATARAVVYVAEVAKDPEFAPFRAFAQSVPFTSVLSAPLMASDGECLGVVSVQSKRKFVPTGLELAALKDFTRIVADRIAEIGKTADLATLATALAGEIQPGGLRCADPRCH
jgi:GAF domain-containing protein